MFTIPRFNTTCRGIIAHKQINILYRKLLCYNFTHLLLLLPCHRCYCYTIVFCVFNHVICIFANNCYYLYCSTYN